MKRTFGLGALTMISAACVTSAGGSVGQSFVPVDAAVFAPPPLPAKDAEPVIDASLVFPGTDGAVTDANVDPPTGPACAANVPMTAADLDKDIGWKPAQAPHAACTAEEIAQFGANLNDMTLTQWSDLAKGLGMPCADCIVTSHAATNWGPIVTNANMGTGGFTNFGACFGHVFSESCGKAIQYDEFCLDVACEACLTTQERQDCAESAVGPGGMCFEFAATVNVECPNLGIAPKECLTAFDSAKFLCGPNAGKDGGTDAGDGGP
jgi:hypothetical protein